MTDHTERELRDLAELGPDLIVHLRFAPEAEVSFANEATVPMLGCRPEELVADPGRLVAAAHADDAELLRQLLAAPGEAPAAFTARCTGAGGELVWLDCRLGVRRGDAGAVVGAQLVARDVTASRQAEAELSQRATHDELTGLPNRRAFGERLDTAVAGARRTDEPLGVLLLELDEFKALNDELGRAAGDRLLVAAAERLRGAVRPGDHAARLEGVRFAVLLDALDEPHAAVNLAERIRDEFRAPFEVDGKALRTTVSIGLAYLAEAGVRDPADLLAHADTALALAHERGNDRYEIFDAGLREELADRLRVRQELYESIDAGLFRLHYQPVVELGSGQVVAVEALVRWQHPTRGLRSAGEFIHLAEEHGLILPLGAWVLDDACQQLHRWLGDLGAGAPIVSVNLSARQLHHPSTIDHVAGVLEATDVDPAFLRFELSEQTLMDDTEGAARQLDALRNLGVRIALDNFGTGYTSLTSLQRFPLDGIKVDRSVVDGVGSDDRATAIVTAIVEMAHALGFEVTAEGVEHEGQLEALRHIGCDHAQGYHLSKPQSPDDLAGVIGGAPAPPA
jgi:diguanylate cyclase (GGDEF)-like protein